MNEQLQQQLSTLLEWTEKATQTSAEFISIQTPLLIQELLRYNFWTSLCWGIVGLLIILSSVFGMWKAAKYCIKNEESELLSLVALLLIPVSLGVMMMTKNSDWFKISVAPRLYIVDYLRTELKK